MPERKTGTLVISDLLAVDDQSIIAFGENRIAQIIAQDLARLNARVNEQLGMFASIITRTQDRISKYGGNYNSRMAPADEMGRPVAKKVKVGVNVGFPLRKFTDAVGWTRDYFLQHTPAELAAQYTAIQKAYRNRLQTEMQKAIYRTSNYTSRDIFVDDYDLPVKCFVNADGADIPNGPNGEEFDSSTHNHYTAESTLTNAGLKAAVSNVTEHGHTTAVRIFINKADEDDVRGLEDFKELPDPRLTYRATDTPTRTLALDNAGNRLIGYFDVAEVWVKPWAIANYAFVSALGDEKPLKFRQHNVAQARGLRFPAQLDAYPLRADVAEAYLGFGVWNRTNGAVHYFGGSVYTVPTIE